MLHVETHAVLGAVHEAHPGPAPAGLGDADDAGHPGVEIRALIRAVYARVVERLSLNNVYHFSTLLSARVVRDGSGFCRRRGGGPSVWSKFELTGLQVMLDLGGYPRVFIPVLKGESLILLSDHGDHVDVVDE